MENSRFKFRAWNGKSMEHGGFCIHATGSVMNDHSLSKVKFDSPVMQFTGLTDKHGVDIYEGDIVRESHSIKTVIYEAPGYYPFQYSGGGEFDAICCEVIGNIHQNPELLT